MISIKSVHVDHHEINQTSPIQPTPTTWRQWGKAAFAFTTATGAYAISKAVGMVWNSQDSATVNASSDIIDKQIYQHSIASIEKINNLNPIFVETYSSQHHVELENKFDLDDFNYHQQFLSNKEILFLTTSLSLMHSRISVSLNLAAFFMSQIDLTFAAYPTVANPIPPQYVEPGQAFNFTFDLNHIFNDTDGDVMSFGGVTLADGSPLASWVRVEPVNIWGREFSDNAKDVDVVGEIAYVASYYKLSIFNISDVNNKIILSSYTIPGYDTQGITIHNGIAYVAKADLGLQLIDVNNVTNPHLIGTYNTASSARSVTVQSNIAYVANGNLGLLLIDVRNVSNPYLLDSYDTPGYARDVIVQNGVAFVADDTSGLQIINVTNVNSLTLIGNYTTSGRAYGIAVQSDIVYVADHFAGIQLIDVSNVSTPSLLSDYNTPGSAVGITVQNNVAYVADYQAGIQLIDVINATNPILLSNYKTPGLAWNVVVQNSIAYVADESSHLQMIEVSNPTAPSMIGNYGISECAFGADVDDLIVYVANGGLGLQLINATSANNISLLDNYNTPGFARNVFVQNGTAYVADWESLQIINISNSGMLNLLGNYNALGTTTSVVVANGIAYLGKGETGMHIINISDPMMPNLLSVYNTPGSVLGIFLQNGVVYVADDTSGLQFINVSNLSMPTLLSSHDTTGSAKDVVVKSNIAYVADGRQGLQLINVNNISNPNLLESYGTPGDTSGVMVQSGVAYAADGYSGIQFINITDPTSSLRLGQYDTPGIARDIIIINITAYIADSGGGLQILDLSQTRLIGIMPATATGIYNFSVHATNENREWIATDFQLQVGGISTLNTAIDSLDSLQTSDVGSSENTQAITQNPPGFSINSNSILYAEIGVEVIITTEYLSVEGFTGDPNQLIFNLPENPAYTVTVNGEEQNSFPLWAIQQGFVGLILGEEFCFEDFNEIPVQATDGSSTADFNLVFRGNTASCNFNNAATLNARSSFKGVALLLVGSGFGIFASRQREKINDKKTESNLLKTQNDDNLAMKVSA